MSRVVARRGILRCAAEAQGGVGGAEGMKKEGIVAREEIMLM